MPDNQLTEPRFMLYDSFGSSQKELENQTKFYTQFRDYYGDRVVGNCSSTIYAIGELLSYSINATMIARGHPEYRKYRYPTVVQLHNDHFWKPYYPVNDSALLPSFVKLTEMGWNFAYCPIPKRQLVSIWNFSVFSKSFDHWTWIFILMSLFLVGCLGNIRFRNSINLNPTFLSSLAALLNGSTTGSIQHSVLFTVWMMSSLVMVICYTGIMTSLVISPSPEERISRVSELEALNYTYIPILQSTHEFVEGSIKSLTAKANVHPEVASINRIIKRTWISPYLPEKSLRDFQWKFSRTEKVATFNSWPYALWAATATNIFITSGEGPPTKRRCNVGKKLVPFGEWFLGFVPPGHVKILENFHKLHASGIVFRWLQEFYGTMHSRRVQDRLKIIGPTNMIDEGVNSKFVPLALKGSTVTMFLIWCIGILACVISLVLEVSISKMYEIRNLWNNV